MKSKISVGALLVLTLMSFAAPAQAAFKPDSKLDPSQVCFEVPLQGLPGYHICRR